MEELSLHLKVDHIFALKMTLVQKAITAYHEEMLAYVVHVQVAFK